MTRSIYEHHVAKFFHQKFGITLYPYPGGGADLQTPCGLNIEVKFAYGNASHVFTKQQVQERRFDLAILVNHKVIRPAGLHYIVLTHDEIWKFGEQSIARGLKTHKLNLPTNLRWNRLKTT